MNIQHFQIPFVVLSAATFDYFLGEPVKWHPLVGFGKYAELLEKKLNIPPVAEPDPNVQVAAIETEIKLKKNGVLALIAAIGPFVSLAILLQDSHSLKLIIQCLCLYLAIGASSLTSHALEIASALESKDLQLARKKVSYIVSRDTENLDEDAIAKAAVESVLENGCDALFGAIFWFVVGGAPGVVLYRLANTLDAMWGYKNPRFINFGWAAARFDDLLNFVPARLTAFTYASLGQFKIAIKCWINQAPKWYSPNAGPVMAAGAGALFVSLGGNAVYHNQLKERPTLGEGPKPGPEDIRKATELVNRGMLAWIVILLLAGACNA
jgi:adenosylcobinamide-phosphate synthase